VWQSHPPNPRSKTTVSAVTGGNIAGLLATAFVALFVGISFESYSRMLWNRKVGYGENCGVAEREGLPRSANKNNKIKGLSHARSRRVYQSSAPMSSEMNRRSPLEHPQPDHQSRRSKNAGLTPALLSSHCCNKLPCNSRPAPS
jgi:hypothetical protein